MGKNTGKEYRIGAIINRSQVFNSLINKFVKRDTVSGKFMTSKDSAYKGIRVEKNIKNKVKEVKEIK